MNVDCARSDRSIPIVDNCDHTTNTNKNKNKNDDDVVAAARKQNLTAGRGEIAIRRIEVVGMAQGPMHGDVVVVGM
jgi:hypothetical protein